MFGSLAGTSYLVDIRTADVKQVFGKMLVNDSDCLIFVMLGKASPRILDKLPGICSGRLSLQIVWLQGV